jgi:mono/diheme cytochrome c family protein
MPAFQEAFSDAQRWDIVNFVRTLAPKESNNNATK